MTFRLVILPRAECDAQHIFEWLAKRSPQGAMRWWAAFEEAARQVVNRPRACALAPEESIAGFELRQFLFKTRRGRTYRGVFTLVGEEVRVLRVRGPGQPPLESDEIAGP